MAQSSRTVEQIQLAREEQLTSLRKTIFEYKKKCYNLESFITLALVYLEDGAINSAIKILKESQGEK